MPAHGPPKRVHFSAIFDDVVKCARLTSTSDAPPNKSLRVCVSDWISDPPVLWIKIWNLLFTFSKWDFVEMEYPVRDVAAFRSPPMILRRLSNLFISAWMWVFTRLQRSGRLAVAWWMIIMLIRSPRASSYQDTKRVHRPCVPAPLLLGNFANSQPVLTIPRSDQLSQFYIVSDINK